MRDDDDPAIPYAQRVHQRVQTLEDAVVNEDE